MKKHPVAILRGFPRWLTDKYLIAGTSFLVWMLFFDHNDIPLQWQRARELNTLKQASRHYSGQIEETRRQLEEMRNSPIALEKVARERYLMKRDREQVFVITP